MNFNLSFDIISVFEAITGEQRYVDKLDIFIKKLNPQLS